ncbi:MAG: Fic family protein, partial [Bacilli bacterium]|nr:Fic family protein [Bacilli bacterium]
SIKDLHEKLYSCSRHPEFGGNFRRDFAYLKGSKTDVCDWRDIFYSLRDLDDEVELIRACSSEVRSGKSPKLLLEYINRCVDLNCHMIRIHPFADGNGRTIRGFTNKLFEDGGLPPVYINVAERDEYLEAMAKAMEEEDYSLIHRFYKYKICDSIYELDIADRLKRIDAEEKREKPVQKQKTFPDFVD